MFPHFDRRLQRDLQHIVNERLEGSESASGRHMKVNHKHGSCNRTVKTD